MSDEAMTDAQYRCLVAYMMYWSQWDGCSLDRAIYELRIEVSREQLITQLFGAGYDYDPSTDRIRYTGDDERMSPEQPD